MYEWLEKEINEIKTLKFHVIETEKGKLDITKTIPADFCSLLPPSYIAFISKFGGAKLYKKNTGYQVSVLNLPQKKILKSGEEFLCVGHFDDLEAYFKYSLLIPGKDSPVYSFCDEGFEK